MENAASPIIGIDLGTTNSLVGVFEAGQARLIQNVHGKYLTPSVVGLSDDDEIIIGESAKNRLVSHPHLTAAVFKRSMGSAKIFRMGKKEFRPEELSSLVLKSLKHDAETALGIAIERAVITVPAYFRDAQRNATRIAGELAGLHVERIVNEPTAASLAYGLHNRDAELKILVFDLGGGTFDVSVLDLFEGVVEVRASAGDNFLGGEDFLESVIFHFRKQINEKYPEFKLDKNETSEFDQVLRSKAEWAKNNLSDQTRSVIHLTMGKQDIELTITRDDFSQISGGLIERLKSPVLRALRDARIKTSEINEVLLVGGATRMPLVRDTVTRMFGKFPNIHLQPDEAIGLGAAVMAGLKAKNKDLKEMVLTDVAPFSLGIEIATGEEGDYETGIFSPIIERNSVIPISREETYNTLQKGQRKVDVKIFQGENRKVSDNVYLGKLDLRLPAESKTQEFKVRFSYDLNGILEVETTDVAGVKHTLVLQENPGSISKEDVEQSLKKLSKLKIHPREASQNFELITRGERLFSESLRGERTIISHHIHLFEAALNRQDMGEIERAREIFRSFLDEIESDLKNSP